MSQRFKILTPYHKLLPHFPFKDVIVLKIRTQQAAKRTAEDWARGTHAGHGHATGASAWGAPGPASTPPPRSTAGVSTGEKPPARVQRTEETQGRKQRRKREQKGSRSIFMLSRASCCVRGSEASVALSASAYRHAATHTERAR